MITTRVVLTGLSERRRRTNSPRKSRLAEISLVHNLKLSHFSWTKISGWSVIEIAILFC